MTDKLDRERRSENMRRIRSKNTSPELIVRRMVYSLGFRYRLHVSTLPGKPDLVFARLRKVIDVRGCFWHQHKGCIEAHIPKSKTAYWRAKLEGNRLRDRRHRGRLRALGFKVLVVWECETRASNQHALKRKLERFLLSG